MHMLENDKRAHMENDRMECTTWKMAEKSHTRKFEKINAMYTLEYVRKSTSRKIIENRN